MPFAIVQTLENGKKLLSCVPEGWVKNNFLAWPRKKADKLTKEENSLPDADWFWMPCGVKRSGLTYNEGQLAITVMAEITDTDEDETSTKTKEEGKVSRVQSHNDIVDRCLEKAAIKSTINQQLEPPGTETAILQDSEFAIDNEPHEFPNEMPSSLEHLCHLPFANVLQEPSNVELSSKTTLPTDSESAETSSTYINITADAIPNQRVEYILMPPQETNVTTSSENDFTKKFDSLITTVKGIEKSQIELQDTQNKLMERFIAIQTQFEQFLKSTQKENLQKEIGFNSIKSLDDLQKLETILKDNGSTIELINKLSLVCGTGKGRGLNNCFTLVDVIFDRSFLTTCSWAGGARGEDKKKICFKSFERVIQLFFSIIFRSDKNFTMKECEDFFKNVLRNSNRRNTAKMVRCSATKTRETKNKIQEVPTVLNPKDNSQSEPG